MNIMYYEREELIALMKHMSGMYDLVRLVNPEECREWILDEQGNLVIGSPCYQVWNEKQRCANCGSYKACRSGKRIEKSEVFDGDTYHILMVPVDISLGDDALVRCVLECITRTKGIDQRIIGNGKVVVGADRKVLVDPLTGLHNWDGFFQTVREQMEAQPEKDWVIIVYDIASFKLVNDLFGEEKGDEILLNVAAVIKSKCQTGEVCARLRGDLFAVCIYKEHYDSSFAISASRDLPDLLSSSQFHLHIQGGVYIVEDKSLMVSSMVDRAQLALSTIKGSNERRIIEFDDYLMEKVLKEQQIITDFRRALEAGEFHMFLQPQVFYTGEVKGAEALVRWIRKDGTIVSPGEFLEVLERTELITELDRYMWEQAAKTLADWKGTDKENLYISVNISPRDFFFMDVHAYVNELLSKYNLDKKQLKLEITETILMQDESKQLALINQLHDEGFDIEIDDFGKGYSSLSLLKDINADVLKIDKEFLRETENSKRSEKILGTVIDMSDRLSIRVITEGVETKEQLEKMIKLGCNLFQGYYFAKPMSVSEFEKRWSDLSADI